MLPRSRTRFSWLRYPSSFYTPTPSTFGRDIPKLEAWLPCYPDYIWPRRRNHAALAASGQSYIPTPNTFTNDIRRLLSWQARYPDQIYPRKTNPALMASGLTFVPVVAVASAAVFRRTLSGVGTRVGSRQTVGW